jgi:hypothetical protein
VRALPAHAALETYAVLTRLPGGLAVPAPVAARVLGERFPDPPLQLGEGERRELLRRLPAAAVFGDASYDGLVGLEATAHGETLLTLDRRAEQVYARLGVAARAIAAD